MSGLSASGLRTQIRSYTEVDDTVLTDSVLENIILNAQQRIFMDLPMDSDRHVQEGTLVANNNTINAPAGCMFVRGIEVFESTANTEGNGKWLEKKDQTQINKFDLFSLTIFHCLQYWQLKMVREKRSNLFI